VWSKLDLEQLGFKYERTDPKYADMVASAIVHARNMMRRH